MFINITDNLMVNSDLISAIEIRTVRDNRMLIVHIGEKTYTATVSPDELLSKLQNLGLGEQFVRE